MIGFFRKIRKKFADENQFIKYSRYAIGEIVLVVIGILIALSINNWNIERINRIEEKAYLNRIVVNLERDLINIMKSSEAHSVTLITGVQVLDSLGNNNRDYFKVGNAYTIALKKKSAYKNLIPDNFGEMLYRILQIQYFYKSDVAFQELLATGKMDIIKNQELKVAIQEHYLKVAEIQNFQDRIVMTIQNNFRDALNKNNISVANRESYAVITDKFIDTQRLIVALENYLNITEASLNMFIHRDDSIKKRTESLISQIKKELDMAK